MARAFFFCQVAIIYLFATLNPTHTHFLIIKHFLIAAIFSPSFKAKVCLKKRQKDIKTEQENECLTFIWGKRREGIAACYVGLDRSRSSLA